MGLHRAGYDVTGIDIIDQPNYPFTFHMGDALEADLQGYDFAWASPPCQAHTSLKHLTGKEYECYIERIRAKLKAWGGPYIIENVVGAPLINPVMLCGSSLGLRVRRHRTRPNRPKPPKSPYKVKKNFSRTCSKGGYVISNGNHPVPPLPPGDSNQFRSAGVKPEIAARTIKYAQHWKPLIGFLA